MPPDPMPAPAARRASASAAMPCRSIKMRHHPGDIKLTVLLQEAFRHCKALGAWGDGTAILEAAGITAGAPGVVTGDAAGKSFTDRLAAAVGLHRAWDRASAVMASAVPPVLTS